jgi:arylsulfatase A-like enzyme
MPPKLVTFISLTLSGLVFAAAEKPSKPNVIFIYSDDHGYTDLGIHGIDPNVKTPALDQLAANGALMKYGYSSAPQCVPSRAGLMTGRVQNTFGLRGNGDSDEPIPADVPTIAERMQKLGYRTGFVGKWHLGGGPNAPANRGFQDYHDGAMRNYSINYDLDGKAIPKKQMTITGNRVVHQGKAGAAFIEKNHDKPFFLYLALYGPHTPLIDKDDPYYLNTPAVDYPNTSPEIDDIRRRGLGIIRALDDAVDGVMKKLREHGIEDNTLIFFAADNGAQPKYSEAINGESTLAKWDGSENVPLRGEKGSLWEGGIKVPMLAYWKGQIPPGQVIKESIITLDFTATTLKLGGGSIPPEFDGTDILPLLTKKDSTVTRAKKLFWDWGDGIALQDGGWKIHRYGKQLSLFNIQEDPNEFFDLQKQEPDRFKYMEAALMKSYNSLPDDGKSNLRNKEATLYVKGAPAGTPVDPRFTYPYQNGKSTAYPAPLKSLPQSEDSSNPSR